MMHDTVDWIAWDVSLARFGVNSQKYGFLRLFALVEGRILYQPPLFMTSAASGEINMVAFPPRHAAIAAHNRVIPPGSLSA